MRAAVTILICATAFVFADARNARCPENYTKETVLPHERCNRFYQCVGGELVSQRCAANLKFNVETQRCDWPDNVECGDRDDTESEEIIDDEPENNNVNDDPSLAPIICAAEGSDGILISHEKCNKFYICSAGIPVAMRCPEGLLYNPFKDQCDWPENVRCVRVPENDIETSNEEDSNEGNNDPSQAPVICAAEGSDGILVANEYCNKFYICSSGLRITIKCPPNLLYNPRKEQCDWPSSVNCGNRIIPDINSISSIGIDDTVGKVISNSFMYNRNSANINNQMNNNALNAPAICAKKDSDGILVAHEVCNRFYKCAEGLPVTIRCQLNLVYNPSTEQCDWPENVNCGNRIISDDDSGNDNNGGSNGNSNSGNTDPSEAPAICAAEGSDGILIAHEYCGKFYKCFEGLPETIMCPVPLLYNPTLEQCDWSRAVDCGERLQ